MNSTLKEKGNEMNLAMYSVNGCSWTKLRPGALSETRIKVTAIAAGASDRYSAPLILSPSLKARLRACASPPGDTIYRGTDF